MKIRKVRRLSCKFEISVPVVNEDSKLRNVKVLGINSKDSSFDIC